MTTHRETRIVAASSDRLFTLVADVERYPDYLPMWKSARVYRHAGDVYFTQQEIGLGPIRERFRTRTELTRSTHIVVTSADRLFREFGIRWEFEATGDETCRVTVALTWRVRSPLLQRVIDLALPETARKMVSAFERQATRAR